MKKPHNLDHFDRLALGSCIAAFTVWAYLLVRKYLNFGYYDWDLAFFNQAAWNILHGSLHVSLFDVNFFSNHSNFIVYLCLPIYVLFSHPLTLVFLKVISFVGGSYILYMIGKEKVGPRVALLLMWLYLFYPPNLFGIVYEFDFESLSPIFSFALFLLFMRKELSLFLITALILISIKENMPMIVVAFGIFALFTKDRDKWKWGALPIVLGLISFYLLTSSVIPYFGKSKVHSYIGFYSSFGKTPTEVILNILLHPWELIPYLTNPLNKKFLFDLFSPLMFLPLLSPHILFLISPNFIQYLLSSGFQHHTIYYQYALNLAPFIFLAALSTLSFLQHFFRRTSYLFILILMIMLSGLTFIKHLPALKARLNLSEDHLGDIRWKMVERIPADAPVMASFDFLAELSGRKELYAFYKVYNFAHRETFELPSHVELALIDFNDRWLEEIYRADPLGTSVHLQEFFKDGWGVEEAAENIILFKKGNDKKIIEIDTLESNIRYNDLHQINDTLAVRQSLPVPAQVGPNTILPLSFDWSVYEAQEGHYVSQILIAQGEKIFAGINHLTGYKIYPSIAWKKGDLVRERYWLTIPSLPPGNYDIELSVVDMTKKKAPATIKLVTITIP